MVIDMHYHLVQKKYGPREHWQRWAFSISQMSRLFDAKWTDQEIEQEYLPRCWDQTGEATIRSMDENGISVRVLAGLDNRFTLAGLSETPFEQQCREVAAVARRFPDRFVYFFGVDPRRSNALDLLTQAIEEGGARGLKLLPIAGFYPDDRIVYPLLEKAEAHGLPVLFHTGSVPRFATYAEASDYGDPAHLDKVLTDFPGLKVIAAHLAFECCGELMRQAQKHPNLLCDISVHQIMARLDYDDFCRGLRAALDSFGKERVLFATDGPMPCLIVPDKDWIGIIGNLPSRSPKGVVFREDEVEHILHLNAEKLLGLGNGARQRN